MGNAVGATAGGSGGGGDAKDDADGRDTASDEEDYTSGDSYGEPYADRTNGGSNGMDDVVNSGGGSESNNNNDEEDDEEEDSLFRISSEDGDGEPLYLSSSDGGNAGMKIGIPGHGRRKGSGSPYVKKRPPAPASRREADHALVNVDAKIVRRGICEGGEGEEREVEEEEGHN